MLSTAVAHRWLDRWDRQQEYYMADREERFTVIGDVLEAVTGDAPRIVDLGVGPGSLSVRLLGRFPQATVVGVDADPLLLGLARAAYADHAGLRLVQTDLREPGWLDALGLERPVDAFVSTTALHWLRAPELADLYATLAGALRAGGVFVNGDHLFDRPVRPRLDKIGTHVAECRAARIRNGSEPTSEDWAAWWEAVHAAPELTDLVRQRQDAESIHSSDPQVSIDTHVDLLLEAGFTEAGTVWQHGDDRVLVAIG